MRGERMEPRRHFASAFRASRISRRTVVRGLGAGLVGASLSGCAAPSAAPTVASQAAPATSAPATTVGAVATPTATRPQPKYGGLHRESFGTADPPHFDPHQTNSSALLAYGPGI